TTLDKFKDKWHIAINKKEIIVSDGMFAQKVVKQYDHLKQALIAKNMLELYETIEFPLIDVLYRMESHGISVDEDNLARLNEDTLAKVTALEKEIFELTQHEFNVNSPKQLAEVLYDELGLPQIKKRSTAIDVLEALLMQHPVIEKIIEYRKFQKFYSTYTAGLQKHIGPDHKIHTVYNQCATQTGRLSSNHPNMQNISVKNEETAIIRKIFVAEADSVLLSADYSQIELRLLAHMAQEQAMLDAFNHHLDIHAKTAMDIFGVTFEDVTDAMRRQAKAVNFGIIYGMSDYGLAQQINVTRKEASQFMKSYHQSFPKIAKFMEDTIAFAQANGYVQTIFKRRRAIDELYSSVYSVREFGKRAAMNAPIQGSAADLMKIAMLKVDAKLREKQAKSTLLLQVHDEIVLNVTHDELDWVKTMVEAAMVEVVTLDVPLEVSISVGQNWYEAK
ncbi:MAG: DNA polymerase I, partial [Erysipelothrix sp.]|nr:DNA polymerase I [Erysipelothrix sp.]